MYDLAGADEGHRFSPNCWRVKMACAHKGLPLETIPWRFTEKDQLPQPSQGMVPVLVDGSTVVADSWQILRYLEDHYPARPLFGSEQAVGVLLFFKFWVERVIQPWIGRIIVRDVWSALAEKDRTYFRETRERRFGKSLEEVVKDREQAAVRLREALEPARATVQEQPFLSGGSPAAADYVLFGAFQWARCTSDFELLAADDPLYGWRNRILELFEGVAANALSSAPLLSRPSDKATGRG